MTGVSSSGDGGDASLPVPPALREALAHARALGFLGPGPLDRHLAHARGFGRTIEWAVGSHGAVSSDGAPGRLVDLGSGGGLPGLVLAVLEPGFEVVLVEANARRCGHLEEAVRRCDLSGRVEVVQQRAEVVGRDPRFRGGCDVVTARSFGPPAVTAECAAPLLRVGGFLVTSEPPAPPEPSAEAPLRSSTRAEVTTPDPSRRWPSAALTELGMTPLPARHDTFRYQVVRQDRPCPDRYPRRVGVPAKRPLF